MISPQRKQGQCASRNEPLLALRAAIQVIL
jgi:hypothetical protein